jgi:hypothetical protein
MATFDQTYYLLTKNWAIFGTPNTDADTGKKLPVFAGIENV